MIVRWVLLFVISIITQSCYVLNRDSKQHKHDEITIRFKGHYNNDSIYIYVNKILYDKILLTNIDIDRNPIAKGYIFNDTIQSIEICINKKCKKIKLSKGNYVYISKPLLFVHRIKYENENLMYR